MARKRWTILDKWSWNLTDCEGSPRPGGVVYAWVQDRRRNFPGAQVRVFRRHVRAGGATVELVVGVVRREWELPVDVGAAVTL